MLRFLRQCAGAHVVGGKMEVTGKRRGKRKQLLDDHNETRFWKLKEDALDRAFRRIRFGRGCGAVVRQTTR
jgi:hypothetical protein